MGDIVIWFPKGKKEHTKKFQKWWFGSCKIQYYLPNNTILFVNIDKFEPNPIWWTSTSSNLAYIWEKLLED
jgi:hypothetical protein